MALLSCQVPQLINDSSLGNWTVIGSGGFGQIYKARHHQWCYDVAVKILYSDNGRSSSLLREVNMMLQGRNPHVIQVFGVFQGRLLSSGPSQLGLVMEYMERGCLASLQETIRKPPPWPLVFRLAHQVALGVNFLHSLSPALLHLDLKPSNVLLDSDLKAKLTDFGLARFYRSVTRPSKKDSDEEGGTISYMPPEAFELSYQPTKASDIYSYGVLLWSIVTGKQPYANAKSSIVKLRIPMGDRPLLEDFRSQASGLAELEKLMELTVKCWDAEPQKRPTSYDCTIQTEELYEIHKDGILDAVDQVRRKLDEMKNISEGIQHFHITQDLGNHRAVHHVHTGRPPVQEMAGGQRNEATVKEVTLSGHANVCHHDHSCSSPDIKVKVSSVHPIASSPPTSTRRSPKGRSKANLAYRENLLPQRQFSSPDTFPCNLDGARDVNICFSKVTGVQIGNNNTMIFHPTDLTERKRHPTAPSSVNLPPRRSGSVKKKTGGVG